MPRKLSEDVLQVINILRSNQNNDNWDFVSIEDKKEILQILNIIRKAAVAKVSFAYFNNNYGSFSLRCNKIINHEHLTYIETFGIIQFTSVIGLLFS